MPGLLPPTRYIHHRFANFSLSSFHLSLCAFFALTPHPLGTPGHRPHSHIKRHASFESPREVPLPSPSLSSISPGVLSSSAAPFFSNLTSNSTPSATTTASNNRISHSPLQPRTQDVSDYFPLQPRPNTLQSSPSSSGSSGQSSNASRHGSFSPRRFSGFEGERGQQDRGSARSDSDWTSQTSPSPPICAEDGQEKNLPSATDLAPASSQSSQLNTTGMGPGAMTQSPQPPSKTEASVNGTRPSITPIFPYARPYSLPDPHLHSKSYSTTPSNHQESVSTTPNRNQPSTGPSTGEASHITWADRSSSASLPLPMQIPFYTLLKAGDVPPAKQGEAGTMGSPRASGGDSTQAGPQPQPQPHFPYHHSPHLESSASSSSSSSYGSLQSPGDQPNRRVSPPPVPPVNKAASTGNTPGQAQSEQQRTSLPPPRRPVSPFRAPQPRPTTANAAPPTASSSSSTAMPRPMTNHGVATYSPTASSSYPAPEPPIILAPSSDGPGQPYDPFLSHAPPPADSWIQVETSQGEYRLNVRLPGFRRDGITLATKRRRILHVVADSWENGGGKSNISYLLHYLFFFSLSGWRDVGGIRMIVFWPL